MAAVVTGAMGTLLPKMVNLIEKEYKLQRGLRGEIMFLKAEMESMETVLIKISEAPMDEPLDIQVKLWAKAVRELSYDLEDNIDKFMVRIETGEHDKSHSFMVFIHKSVVSLLTKAPIRHKIGVDIKGIKIRIKEISERRERYKVDTVAAKATGPTVHTLRLSALYKKATDQLVGTDQKSLELVHMLAEGDDLKVVSIVGLGGLGKTTLANAVFEKLKVQFDVKKTTTTL